MAKSRKKPSTPKEPRESASITYHRGENPQRVEIEVPVKPGHGERLINEAQKAGADVEHVRAQVMKLPHA